MFIPTKWEHAIIMAGIAISYSGGFFVSLSFIFNGNATLYICLYSLSSFSLFSFSSSFHNNHFPIFVRCDVWGPGSRTYHGSVCILDGAVREQPKT